MTAKTIISIWIATAALAACAKAGVPLALLDEASGTLYIPVASEHKNPFIEKKVMVTGTLIEKGGVKGFVIKTVEAAK